MIKNLFWIGMVLLLAGCREGLPSSPSSAALTSSPTVGLTTPTTHIEGTATPADDQLRPSATPTLSSDSVKPTASPEPTETQPDLPMTETPEASVQPYPPPGDSVQPYPPPGENNILPTSQGNDPYPPPQTNTNTNPTVTLRPTRIVTPTRTPTVTSLPSPTYTPTPTRSLVLPTITPVTGLSGQVTIWHSWGTVELQAFIQVIDAFQDINPDVRFNLTYIPFDELKARYESETYKGRGPSILVGSSDWIAALVSQSLVEDLTKQLPDALTSRITEAALSAGSFQKAQSCLPYSMKGMLLYRNSDIIPAPADSFDELVQNAQSATRAGIVGAYLERGSYYSAAHLTGIGGVMIDDDGKPVFNANSYRLALDWVSLLKSFEKAGATEFYGNRDLAAFKEGKIGYIIEASWKMNELSQAVGEDNLVIDPWPTYHSGHLSGYVQPGCLYLNINTVLLSDADFQSSVQFMQFVLQKDVQSFIAEAGFIPVTKDAVVKNTLIQQAITAFQDGSAYSPYLVGSYGAAYWDALDAALLEIFQTGADPLKALTTAYLAIQARLEELNP